jgi:D-sedoheptulose 7-phosphate isomerase
MHPTRKTFPDSLTELKQVLSACFSLEGSVDEAGACIIHALRSGNKLMTCGNGGSAADALHLAEELVGRYSVERVPLPAICLNADVTALTCIANDFGYEQVFARQTAAFGKPGDVLVGFSTSGNSRNVLAAFEVASRLGVVTVLLAGGNGGEAKGRCNHELIVPSRNTARIQEVHTLILHQWLEMIDAESW